MLYSLYAFVGLLSLANATFANKQALNGLGFTAKNSRGQDTLPNFYTGYPSNYPHVHLIVSYTNKRGPFTVTDLILSESKSQHFHLVSGGAVTGNAYPTDADYHTGPSIAALRYAVTLMKADGFSTTPYDSLVRRLEDGAEVNLSRRRITNMGCYGDDGVDAYVALANFNGPEDCAAACSGHAFFGIRTRNNVHECRCETSPSWFNPSPGNCKVCDAWGCGDEENLNIYQNDRRRSSGVPVLRRLANKILETTA